MKRQIILAAIIVSSILVCSCGARHTVKFLDERHYPGTGFDYEVLREKGLAVCGFPSGPVLLSSMQQMQYGMILSNILLTEMEGVDQMDFLTPALLLDILGKEQYTARLQNFDMLDKMDNLTFEVLQDSLISPGYALFAQIESDQVFHRQHESYEENGKGEVELIIEYYTEYHMNIWFRLYDLKTGSVVFSMRVRDVARKSEEENLGAGCVTQAINSMVNSLIDALISADEPAEITREEVLKEIILQFAENFPLRTAPFKP